MTTLKNSAMALNISWLPTLRFAESENLIFMFLRTTSFANSIRNRILKLRLSLKNLKSVNPKSYTRSRLSTVLIASFFRNVGSNPLGQNAHLNIHPSLNLNGDNVIVSISWSFLYLSYTSFGKRFSKKQRPEKNQTIATLILPITSNSSPTPPHVA